METNEKQKEKKQLANKVGGGLFIGAMFVGMAGGMFFGNMVIGMFAGMGIGFLFSAVAYLSIMNKN